MKNRIKRLALCLLTAVTVIAPGRVYADAEQSSADMLTSEVTEKKQETQKNASSEQNLSYRCCAENDKFRLLVDDENAAFGLENIETGYIWQSSPVDAYQGETASDFAATELLSSSMLRYGVVESRSDNNLLRSNTPDCRLSVSDIENGVRVIYSYESAGFEYPVDYTLEDDCLKASVKVSEIKETDPANIATELTILGSFGAASDTEDGYFVIPDGSGALIRFNNSRTDSAYSQRVYGTDTTAVPVTKGAVTEQIYLPVYGIVKEDNAMLVVAAKGDSNAVLNANVSGQSGIPYNRCSFTFTLRGTDTFYMSGSTESITVFERGKIKSDDIELRYYPISAQDADYVDIASRYREYLIESGGAVIRTEADKAPMYLSLYGGTMKKKPIMGIPLNMKTAVTSYEQAVEILQGLKSNGADDIVVTYNNWTSDGIGSKIDTSAKPSGTLGGKTQFSKLTQYINENGLSLYPASDNRDFYSGNGYFSFFHTTVRISGSYSRIVSYDRAYGVPDSFKKNMSLLSPSLYSEVYSEVADNYSEADLGGVSLGKLTSSLYGDYGRKKLSRFNAMNSLKDSCSELESTLEDGILANSANACVFPYVNHITNVPLTSSRFDIFDEDIPFFQLVMHGVIPLSTTAVNGNADPENLLLTAAATGSCLSFDMLYEDTSILKDTELDIYYYAGYERQLEKTAREYLLLKPVLRAVSDSFIADYTVENNGTLITTIYENGSVVKVDLEAKTIDLNGELTEISGEGD